MIRRVLAMREAALALVVLALFAVFAFTVEGFADWFNLCEQSRHWIVPGMIAVPMTLIITTAGIDLSVGSMVALCGTVLGLLYRDAQWPIALAAMAAVLVGLSCGTLNGVVSSYLGIPPLVVTLATMALFRGVAMGLSQAEPVTGFPAGFRWLSQGDLFTIQGSGGPVGLPAPLVALVFAVLLGWIVMRRSWMGRYIEFIGDNETAARFAAIDTRLVKCGLYAACGAICGLAAIFHTALFATAKADTAQGLELSVIACVVVGGTRISGGRGTVIGTLFGLLIIGMLGFGLDMAEVDWLGSQHIVIFVGALVIVTAIFNEWMARWKGDHQ